MAKYYFIFFIFLMFNACTFIENVIGSMPDSKIRKCCYINGTKDTIFFSCKKEKIVKLEVAIKNKFANNRLFFWDTSIRAQKNISMAFIYKKIPKDSLLNKYFHIIVKSSARVHGDYWFIIDSADLKSKEPIFSFNKIAR